MIKEYKTLAKPSGTCPLVSIYESVLKGHMNNLDLTLPAENVPQLGTSVSQYTGPTNIEKAINHFPLSTPAGSSSLLAQPVMRNPSIVPTYEGGLETHPNLLPDTSLFDSLSFLDTADCSHQSEQFLANLGISNEIAPFDIEALFAR
ncbi:unnamed protein product [Periconia digitata]|uniref:Uncharacterized protein n=1 Tax=Periconia digitata TaxID=1303443 RepID=A0A9W4U7F1_9PLEO|nr:unnamed protein product [Periconia digitata]